jgi:uncharacterized membrane protein
MLEALLESTALPNLHPALVHFPIALAVAALLFDAALLVRLRWASADAAGAILWSLAAAGAGVAYLAGERAAEDAGPLVGAAEVALGEHAGAALAALIALSLLSLLRVSLAWRDRGADRVGRGILRVVALLGALAVQGFVAYAADLGGALVYRHGLAVSLPEPEADIAAPKPSGFAAAAEASAPEFREDGSLIWSPWPGSEVISLIVSGRSRLALPGSWGDALLEVRIDPSAFDGSVGLGARVDGETSGGLFRIASDGAAALIARSGGRETVLDEAQLPLPAAELTFALSVSGRHWKGFVDGRNVVHGHVSLPVPGRMALLLEGEGTVRVVAVRVAPLGGGNDPRPETGAAH